MLPLYDCQHLTKHSFLVLGGDCLWPFRLAQSLSHFAPTWLSTNRTIRGALHFRRSDKDFPHNDRFTRKALIVPSIFTQSLGSNFHYFLRIRFRRLVEKVEAWSGRKPIVILPYPHMAEWLDFLPSNQLIYYNFDDYTLYNPKHSDYIRDCETRLIQRCGFIFASSIEQVWSFQARCQAPVGHLPHGAEPRSMTNPEWTPPEPETVGYVGNLSHRLDWKFVFEVMKSCPSTRFVFVGGLDHVPVKGASEPTWSTVRRNVLSLPNAVHVGKVDQDEVHNYYARFELSWIPYDTKLPFNRTSSPTKIMDGIAAGRPILATSLPECALYPEFLRITKNAEEAAAFIHDCQRQSETNRRNFFKDAKRYLSENTWSHRARRVISSLEGEPERPTSVSFVTSN